MAQRVERSVGGDAVEPGRQDEIARLRHSLKGLDKGILSQILRLFGVANHTQDVAIDRPLIPREDIVEGGTQRLLQRPASEGLLAHQ